MTDSSQTYIDQILKAYNINKGDPVIIDPGMILRCDYSISHLNVHTIRKQVLDEMKTEIKSKLECNRITNANLENVQRHAKDFLFRRYLDIATILIKEDYRGSQKELDDEIDKMIKYSLSGKYDNLNNYMSSYDYILGNMKLLNKAIK